MNKEYVLVTGASSGIGRAISVKLSESYIIILSGTDIVKLNETKSLCSNPSEQIVFQQDLSDINSLEPNLINFINQYKVSITKYVHSAGITGMLPLKTIDLCLIKGVFNINAISFFIISKILMSKKINPKKLNNIVLISAVVANLGAKALSVYSASKSALGGGCGH